MLRCVGCEQEFDLASHPFRCPNAGTDRADHVVRRHLKSTSSVFPQCEDRNPFVAFRELLVSYQIAKEGGMSDRDFVTLVKSLDRQIAELDLVGFRRTPFLQQVGLGDNVWVKDETGNVSGSHKARHLMGVAIYLEVLRHLKKDSGPRPTLAIASCGNAALAAATVATALGYPIDVFIPTDANSTVVTRLRDLEARLHISERRPDEAGDPCILRFQEAVAHGALPFGCQGSENGLTIEGGQTLGYELASSGLCLDRLFIQVGGGALASSTIQALRDSVALGQLPKMPKIHSVQTQGASPLHRAYDKVVQLLIQKLDLSPKSPDSQAQYLQSIFTQPEVQQTLSFAAQNRPDFMWPWEQTPRSAAHGILDDETYDWLEIVRGMLQSGGFPITVDEATLLESHRLAHDRTDISVCCTGSSGLAGLLFLRSQGLVLPKEVVGLLFTGAVRGDLSETRRSVTG